MASGPRNKPQPQAAACLPLPSLQRSATALSLPEDDDPNRSAAVGIGRRCGPGPSRGCVVAGEQGQHLAQSALLAGGLRQWEVCLDLVAVAAAVFLLDDVAGP